MPNTGQADRQQSLLNSQQVGSCIPSPPTLSLTVRGDRGRFHLLSSYFWWNFPRTSGRKFLKACCFTDLPSASRPCDSYNLNSSPLCNLTGRSGPLYWAEAALALYSEQMEQVPDYVTRLGKFTRRIYPETKFHHEAHEVLMPNTKENRNKEYNAVESDIAICNIYFGKDTMQGQGFSAQYKMLLKACPPLN